jgi:hypothetical protein
MASDANSIKSTEPTWWPDDPYGLIFLPRFVDKVGSRVFAESWTGTEMAIEEFNLLPKLADATMRDRRRADDLLNIHRRDLERLGDVAFARFQDKPEHWLIAQQLAEREYKEAAPALSGRLRYVRAEIIRRSRAGELSLKICHVLGGPPRGFLPEWWDRPKQESLFYRGIIDPDDPFGRQLNQKKGNDHYIYAAPREALDQIVIASPDDTRSQEAKPQPAPVVGAARKKVEVDSPPDSPPESPESLLHEIVLTGKIVLTGTVEDRPREPKKEPTPPTEPPQDKSSQVPQEHQQRPPATKPDESAGPATNRVGRPTDRDMVREEAAWRLRQPGRTKATSLAAFARELRDEFLQFHGEHRNRMTGEVMKADQIEDHVRSLWNDRPR